VLRVKRAYERANKNDGARFLVERLWPRGVKKENLWVQDWLKEVAPSSEHLGGHAMEMTAGQLLAPLFAPIISRTLPLWCDLPHRLH